MDEELRNRLWNILKLVYLDEFTTEYSRGKYITYRDRAFVAKLWTDCLKIMISGYDYPRVISFLQDYFSSCKWYEVYDLIEFFVQKYHNSFKNSDFINRCNSILESEVSGYRFIGSELTPITSQEELIEIEKALESPLKPVNDHIKRALDLLSDRESPDYVNSVKESISAVESICRIITGDENVTLGKCLNKLEREGRVQLHGALKRGFSSLFGYTSSEGGIRHGSVREADVDFDLAKFMLVSCSAFVNYLVSASSKAGITFE